MEVNTVGGGDVLAKLAKLLKPESMRTYPIHPIYPLHHSFQHPTR